MPSLLYDGEAHTRVIVLGAGGMLGRAVLEECGRHSLDIFVPPRLDVLVAAERAELIQFLQTADADVVVNCIGAIPQKQGSDRGADWFFQTNTAWPVILRAALPRHTLLVHPSTDCVFRSSPHLRSVDEIPDALDDYGISKAGAEILAHHPRTLIIRSSIIGKGGGLLQWLVDRPQGSVVTGYENTLWNGVTAVRWTRAMLHLISLGRTGIVQIGSFPVVSKFGLLKMIARMSGRWDLEIQRFTAESPGLRALQSSVFAPFNLKADLCELFP